MGKFESPLGTKKFGNPQIREFNVPDETGDLPSGFSGQEQDLPGIPSPISANPVVRRREQQALDMRSIQDFQNKMEIEEYERQENVNKVEENIRKLREDKRKGISRISEGGKHRIELLMEMTSLNREVDIDGNSFMFKTLKSKEMRDVLMSSSEFDGTIQFPFEIRRQILSRSLIKIAGQDIEQFIGGYGVENILLFIDELNESLLNRLYKEYQILAEETKNKFSIKNKEEFNEVADDLKK